MEHSDIPQTEMCDAGYRNSHHKCSHDFASRGQKSSKGKAETPENVTVSAWHSAMNRHLS